MKLPENIETKILSCIGMNGLNHKTKPLHARRLRSIRGQMIRLSDSFRAYRPSETKYSDAYFLYNFPSNVAKTMHVIAEIRKHYPHLLMGKSHYDVLDVGCGEGAGMVGLYHGLKGVDDLAEFHFAGIDSSRKMLERAKHMLQWHGQHRRLVKTRLFQKNARDIRIATGNRKYDIILFVNSLVEIVEEDILPKAFMGKVYGSLVEGGLLLIIEPALKKLARRVMKLREELTRHKAMKVLLPCFHNGPCALLPVDSGSDWCHQSIAWSPPEYLQVINQGLNREIDVLKFSYLVAVKSKTQPYKRAGYRVVSQLLKEKGRIRCFLCTPRGRVQLIRLDKDRSFCNKGVDEIKKGSIVDIEGAISVESDSWRVTRKTAVELDT